MPFLHRLKCLPLHPPTLTLARQRVCAAVPATARKRHLAVAVVSHMLVVASVAGMTAWMPHATAQGISEPSHSDGGAQSRRLYQIPAGPLSAVLTRLSVETGIRLAGASAEAQDTQSLGVQGRHSLASALDAALAGTGLEAVRQSDGSYLLHRRQTLPEVSVTASPTRPAAAAASALPEVWVTASPLANPRTENSGSYTVQAVSVGSKIEQPLRDVARSISVLTRQQLDDQQILHFNDALLMLPGITSVPGQSELADSYYLRGHRLSNILVDGNLAKDRNQYDQSTNTSMSKYDNIQLLRGPDGLFAGSGEPSGTVNLVRKKPLQDFQLKTNLSTGSWSNHLAEVDISTPLNQSQTVRGRLVASRNDTKKFWDNAHQKKSMLYGVIDANLGPATLLTAGFSRDWTNGAGAGWAPGFPREFNGAPLPIPTSMGLPSYAYNNHQSKNYFSTLEHQFDVDWRAKLSVSRTESESHGIHPWYVSYAATPWEAARVTLDSGTGFDQEIQASALDLNLQGNFRLLDREHRIVAGADYLKTEHDGQVYATDSNAPNITDWRAFNPDDYPLTQIHEPWFIYDGSTTQYGLYAYGRFQVYGPFKIALGGRYASYESERDNRYTNRNQSDPITPNRNRSIFTPYWALMYDISDRWTAYYTMADSYVDQSNYVASSSFRELDPSTGQSFELGIKGEWLDRRLNTNITFFHTTRDNDAVRTGYDWGYYVPGKECCYNESGKYQSKGVEFDVAGQLTRNWHINLGYTYNSNQVEFGDDNGEIFSSYTPRHILTGWTKYQLPSTLSRWTLGGGVRLQSSFYRSGSVNTWNPTGGEDGKGGFDGPTVPYQFMEPGRAVWSSFVEYRINKQWSAALNIDNLFDKQYFTSVGSVSYGNVYGEPRNVRFSLRGVFH